MFEVQGAAQLRETALRLRAAGQIELKNAMYRNIRAATIPAKEAVKRSELARLPKRGGLNTYVASSKLSTRTLIGPKTAGVVLRQTKPPKHDLRAMNRGQLRHPLFGNRDHWYSQQIPSGWFERPLIALAPVVRAGCQVAMDETAAAAGFHL